MTTTETLQDLRRQLSEAVDATSEAFRVYTAKKEIADALSDAVTAVERVVGLTTTDGRAVASGNASWSTGEVLTQVQATISEAHAAMTEAVKYPPLWRLILGLFAENDRPMALNEMRERIQGQGQLNPSLKDPLESIRVACIRLEKDGLVARTGANTYARIPDAMRVDVR